MWSIRTVLQMGSLYLILPIFATALDLNIDDPASIRAAASTVAHGIFSYYRNDAPGTRPENVGLFPYPPYYWWESGAVWAGMVDYYSYTHDASFLDRTTQALLAQVGPDDNYIVPAHKFDEGNDDQAFWGLGLMSAVENRFPNPPPDAPSWFYLLERLFHNQTGRWDTSTCAGGLKWQIYSENAYGYDYKNAVSNGAYFQLAARLARYTGEQTYLDLATRTWDWCERIGLISSTYDIFDGTDDSLNCTQLDHTQWTYNLGIFLHGAAAMYNVTKSPIWLTRTMGLLNASHNFFSPMPNSTDVMFEAVCEPYDTCNTDQFSFKAYLSRFMAKTAVLVPQTQDVVMRYLRASALAAAKSCSGGADGVTCGNKWYVDGWDGTAGLGQQLSALEVIQGLLVGEVAVPYSTVG